MLVLTLAGLGLNLLTGYAGQISLGSGGFMAVGAFATFAYATRVPMLPLPVDFLLGGLTSGLTGFLFSLPSARIKGFYLMVSSLTAQFFFHLALSAVSLVLRRRFRRYNRSVEYGIPGTQHRQSPWGLFLYASFRHPGFLDCL